MARRLPPRNKKGRFIKRGSRSPSRKSRSSPRRVSRMPRRKRGRRKVSLITKLINGGLLALALARPIELLLFTTATWKTKINFLLRESTFGLGTGEGFDLGKGARMYGPMGAAFILKKAISWLRRSMRV